MQFQHNKFLTATLWLRWLAITKNQKRNKNDKDLHYNVAPDNN